MSNTFATRLRDFREARGYTQGDLAAMAFVCRMTIVFLENGSGVPSWHTVQKLAAALEVSTDDLRDERFLASHK